MSLVLRVKRGDGVLVAGTTIRGYPDKGGVKLVIEGDAKVVRLALLADVEASRRLPWLFQLQRRITREVVEIDQVGLQFWENFREPFSSLDDVSPAYQSSNYRVIDATTNKPIKRGDA